MRWAKIAGGSPPPWKCLSRIVCEPATYNVVHTCLASLCVTVHAGVWVRGHTMQKCIPSIRPTWRRSYIHRVLLLNTLTTSGYIPALPFIRFIPQGCLHSCLFQFAWFAICLPSGRSYSSRWKQMFSLFYPFKGIYLFSCRTTALLPQTNNPAVKAVGLPSQAFCLRLALLGMRGWLAALTYELHLSHC